MYSEKKTTKNEVPTGTFLVVDGKRVVTVDKASFNIGRKSDNDIVIDNPHVSRHHAQIRYANEHFVIFDLETTAGTSINGKKIEKAILKPGDVISLGGVPVIFGQGDHKKSQPKAKKPSHLRADTVPTDSVDFIGADYYFELFNYDDEQ